MKKLLAVLLTVIVNIAYCGTSDSEPRFLKDVDIAIRIDYKGLNEYTKRLFGFNFMGEVMAAVIQSGDSLQGMNRDLTSSTWRNPALGEIFTWCAFNMDYPEIDAFGNLTKFEFAAVFPCPNMGNAELKQSHEKMFYDGANTTKIAGHEVVVPVSDDPGMNAANMVFCQTVLNDVAIAALSKSMMQKQIKLYRDGIGADSTLGSLAMKRGELLYANFANVGKAVMKYDPQGSLKNDCEDTPGLYEAIIGLKSLRLIVSASSDNSLLIEGRLETASKKDAKLLVKGIKEAIDDITSEAKRSPELNDEAAAFLEFIEGVDVERRGKCVAFDIDISAELMTRFATAITPLFAK